jgi:hypothetical protein
MITPERATESGRNDTYGVARNLLHWNVRNNFLRLSVSQGSVTSVSKAISAGCKWLRDFIGLRADWAMADLPDLA